MWVTIKYNEMDKKEIELVNDLWQLWEDIHMAGQLVTNSEFTPKYTELKAQVKILNKHFVSVPKGTVCLMDSSFICPIDCKTPALCVDCDSYRQTAR